tara:strand:+ start:21 stop:407 length:387 start_codon:yes stop_codon:yes gene_type:complete
MYYSLQLKRKKEKLKMKWYLKVIQNNYANFNGRACRKEYWMFFLIHMLFLITWMIIGIINDSPLIFGIYILITIIPNLAVTVRRLHDINKSGWFLLISFIPYLGNFILLIFLIMKGNKSDNIYGPSTN